MRKTISILLCAMMLLSACVFAIPANAAEGTAINNAEEFMAMVSTPADATEPTAKYYLAADITLPTTYAEPFWGILDGNGKTLTVTNPVFADFSGEVKNLTIKGEIYYTDANAAGFTTLSSKAFTAINCVNDVDVTVTGTGKWAAGFVADCEKTDDACVFVNCVNNGDIYIDSVAKEKMRGGGFGGIIDSCGFYNCTNNGNIYAKGNIPILGGFVGRIALNTPGVLCEAINCVNNGNVTVDETYAVINDDGSVTKGNGGSDAGGIFGYIGGSGNNGWYKVYGCVNRGRIEAPYRAGGFIGYAWASGSTAFVDIQFCINEGDIYYGRTDGTDDKKATNVDFGSPFVAYTNSAFTTVKYSIDVGTLNVREGSITNTPGKVFCGLSSADCYQYDVNSVYVLNKEQYTWFTWASSESNAANRAEISVAEGIFVTTLEEIKSGKVAYLINQAALEDPYDSAAAFDTDDYAWIGYNNGDAYFFGQKIGTDNFPTANLTGENWIVLNGDKYANGAKVEVEETTAAPETKAPETEAPAADTEAPAADTEAPAADTEAPATQAPETEAPAKSGCGSMIAGGVAILAIIGTALIVKKED